MHSDDALREAVARERERIARWIEDNFGRCSMLHGRGYLLGEDIATRIRTAPVGQSPPPA